MSYATARAQIVSTLEAITGLTYAAQFGSGFRQEREAIAEDIPHSRAFTLAVAQGSTSTREGSAAGRQTTLSMTVSIYYREMADTQVIDEVVMADYIKIRDALLDPGNWNRPTSGIVILSLGGPDAMPFSVDEVDGGRVLDITFPLTISASTS